MRKMAIAAISAVLAMSLIGCGASISGTPTQVVEECQSVPAGQTPIVEITGYVTGAGQSTTENGRWTFTISDDGERFGVCTVMCFTDNNPDVASGERVTVTGTAKLIYSDWISVFDCRVKK